MRKAPLKSRVEAAERLAWRTVCSSACADWAQVRGNGDIDEDTAAAALSFFEVDSLGSMALTTRSLSF